MKRLTINRIAGAGLRANRRAYRSLALGVFLSVFLISAMCLCAQGVLLARQAQIEARVGSQDIFILDCDLPDSELMKNGVERIGDVTVVAKVADSDIYLGYYDESASDMLGRICIEGRMPEEPGEIAVEASALALLRIEAEVGEKISFDLMPVNGIAEARSFTLVGVLNEQTTYLDVTNQYMSGRRVMLFPAMLISSDEAPFTTGRLAVHKLLEVSSDAEQYELMKANDAGRFAPDQALLGITNSGSICFGADDAIQIDDEAAVTIVMMGMLVGALLLATCVGISGALESQLARKTEEIGMLRAVGATKRQIRRIFGREAWLLALVISPVAIALACLAVWAVSRIAPEEIFFRPTPLVLVPILILTVLMILLSSGLPLRRAARIMPMSVIRDTAMLRKTRRIRSKKQFRVARLVSRRQLSLHPGRLIAPALLIASMMFVVLFASIMASEVATVRWEDEPEFELYPRHHAMNWSFADLISGTKLSENDLAQLEALSDGVEISRQTQVNILLDELPDYFTPRDHSAFDFHHVNNFHFREDGDTTAHDAARRALETDKLLIPIGMYIVDFDPAQQTDYILQGDIDMDALNRGEEILVIAPDYYAQKLPNDEGYLINSGSVKNYDEVCRNDFFFADMELELAQLWAPDELNDLMDWPQTVDEMYAEHYGKCSRVDVKTKIGAVVDNGFDNQYWTVCFITTPAGAEALGLSNANIDYVGLQLEETPDFETESALESRISAIAMRGDMEVSNALARSRENSETALRMTLVFGAVAVVFLAVSVSLIAGSVSRRIRADAKKIGTLRAVGADSRVLMGCYSGQVLLSVVIGVVLGLLLFFIMIWTEMIGFSGVSMSYWLLFVPSEIAFVLIVYAACMLLLRLRIRDVTGRSIIDNIREL